MRPETWACVTGGDGRGDISAALGDLTGRSPGLPGRGSARPWRPQSATRRTPAAPAQAPHGHERQLCQPWMEPCESRSGGAVFPYSSCPAHALLVRRNLWVRRARGGQDGYVAAVEVNGDSVEVVD